MRIDMKESILITGAGPNGVTGKRIKERLESYGRFEILCPSSKELNLIDKDAVDFYFKNNYIDFVVHSAVTAPSRGHDDTDEASEVEDNLRMYFNLACHSSDFKKMFYLGSGAEFDKSRDIVDAREEDALLSLPTDKYGFIKSVINRHAVTSNNIYNLRLFGTINPYEPPTRNVITNLCVKAIKGLPFDLRQDCLFSFVDIDTVADFIVYGIDNNLKFHDYNMTIGKKYYISEIAGYIKSLSNSHQDITFKNPGLGKEYTGSSRRKNNEYKNEMDLNVSLEKAFNYLMSKKDSLNTENMDSRWQSIDYKQITPRLPKLEIK